MNSKNKLNVITNIAIIITFIFTIILIVDEIYNMGMFAMNYTYNYNYGTFHSNFNNIQTIEYETNRFNVYNKPDFLYKDIFNKSYFNYLMKVAITFITVLFVIAYGLYYYEKFITDMPIQCNFDTADTFLKKALKCLCDNCHTIIPNCTSNYFISFILIIIIPLSYLIKSLFNNIDFTPTTESTLFGLVYIIIFILLLLKYTYELYSNSVGEKSEKIKIIVSYFTATIVLILSGHIYKYIYKKYTDNPLLNSKKDITVFNDIYKQSPPIKPNFPVKPSILGEFSYDPKNTTTDYKRKKEIIDNYYSAVKTYEADLNYYNQRYDNYKKSITDALGEKVNIVNIFLNITGLNNYLHLIIIGFIIFFAVFYYYFHKDDMIYMCMIYMISILIIMTIMNGIQYYNTYLNKYIIYEPAAHYKSDIATVNTKLNLLLDPTNGEGFYNYLTNTNDVSSDIDQFTINEKNINSIIRNLISNDIIDNINKDDDQNKLKFISDKLTKLTIADNNDIPHEKYELYVKQSASSSTIQTEFISKITAIKRINFYKYPITSLYLNYNNNIKYQITPNYLTLHQAFIYCKSYQLFKLLEKLEQLNYRFISKLKEKYYTILYEIKNNYFTSEINSNTLNNINNNINEIKYAPTEKDVSVNNFIDVYDNFINTEFNSITPTNYIGSGTLNLNNINITSNKIIYDTTNKIFSATAATTINTTKYSTIVIPENNMFNADNLYTTETKGFKLPYKITDNMNNEYYISSSTLNASDIFIKIDNNVSNQITIKQKYESINIMNIIYNYDNTNKLYSYSTPIAIIKEFPFHINYNNSDTDVNKLILMNIILRAFEYNLTRIISSFENSNLCAYFNSSGCSNIQLSSLFTYPNIYDLFTTSSNSDCGYKNENTTGDYLKTQLPSTPSTNYMSFIILLYNIYNYDENRINDIIEYCVYSYYQNSNEINNYSDTNLISNNLNTIKFKINKSNDSYLITKYLKNVFIIKFIIKLYSIFIKTIKYQLEQPGFDSSLCMPNNATKYQKETILYNVINKYFTISGTTATAKTDLNVDKIAIIIQISKNCRYFFNICIYLMKTNMDKTTDLSLMGIMNSIISNYKFYNPDDVDEIKLDELKKEISINCNYYNKYNDVDKKQLSIMKMNADIVSFNFPILAVIFLIFLGEPLFIKS
jgi:hypothetical protein